MQTPDVGATSCNPSRPARRPWNAPAIENLPRLEEITLQSLIWSDEGGFSFLDASDPTCHLG